MCVSLPTTRVHSAIAPLSDDAAKMAAFINREATRREGQERDALQRLADDIARMGDNPYGPDDVAMHRMADTMRDVRCTATEGVGYLLPEEIRNACKLSYMAGARRVRHPETSTRWGRCIACRSPLDGSDGAEPYRLCDNDLCPMCDINQWEAMQ